MLFIKELLLKTDLVIDNQYLDEYVELMLNNLDTSKKKDVTQEHHMIPVAAYLPKDVSKTIKYTRGASSRDKDAVKIANADPNNKRVQLNYADHIKAHLLLTRCGKSYNFILENINACVLLLNLLNPAIENQIVSDLDTTDNILAAYLYVQSTRPNPKDNPKQYQAIKNNFSLGALAVQRKVRCKETGIIYNSIREAEIANNLTKNRLNQILTGRRKQISGMTFEYYNETSGISEVIK